MKVTICVYIGRSLGQFVREDILGLFKDDSLELFIGDIPAEKEERVTRFYEAFPLSTAIKALVPYFLGPYLPFLPQHRPLLQAILKGVMDKNNPIHRLGRLVLILSSVSLIITTYCNRYLPQVMEAG